MTALLHRPVFVWNEHKYALGLTGTAIIPNRKLATASFAASVTFDNGRYKLAVNVAYAGGFSGQVVDLKRESPMTFEANHVHKLSNNLKIETHSATRATDIKGLTLGRKNGLPRWQAGKNIITAGKLGLPYDMTATASVTVTEVKLARLSGQVADDGRTLESGESLVDLPAQPEGVIVDLSGGTTEAEEMINRLMNMALA